MKIVIIGGSHAGIAAAESIKKMSNEHEIILIEKRESLGFVPSSLNFLFQNIPLMDVANLTGSVSPKSLTEIGIDLRLNSLVTKIRPEEQIIEVVNDHQNYQQSYDRLILAMGSEKFSIAESIVETNVSDLLTYKYPTETTNAFHKLKESHHISIIGAGLIGLELANSLTLLPDKLVTVIEQNNRPLFRYFDASMTDILIRRQPKNLKIIYEKTLKSVRKKSNYVELLTYGGNTYRADTAVLALNPRPNSDLVSDPIQLDYDNTIKVNRHMQTDDPNVYAIGDLIKVPFGPNIDKAYLPLISIARRTALIATSHILGHSLSLEANFQRTIASKIFNMYLGSTGITQEESLLLNIKIKEISKSFNYFSKIYEGKFNLTIKLIYSAENHVLLGAQLISSDQQSLQLLSLFSLAVAKRETLESMLLSEYFYAPSLSSDRDFVTETILDSFIS